ncbi:hypothetical protein WOLCODRAFT_143021 [Wolfiporia cocos MD-104 SS10]|uniref:Arrestin-like N-terminal domain-containing protein n=1 Tax=Wolfiporia cocos (strain MD-104) TaxID=742152 RepID=A0A2H3JDH4_WOLCO|nr:hypothetical protein WOLCODRAFT_143021 [Wolfiporia cocos MD-104 SS10]
MSAASIRHPFASVQYYASTLTVNDYTELQKPPPVPKRRSIIPPALRARSPFSLSKKASSPARFVKKGHQMTLILDGQGTTMPVYRCNDTISGSVLPANASGLTSLQVKIHGSLKIKEVAGAGGADTEILRVSVFSWNDQQNISLPSRIPLHYTLPDDYRDNANGERYPLPPTYDAHLNGIPGFNVYVMYYVLVEFVRAERKKSPFWQKKFCIRAPFLLQQHTRPVYSGPFRLNFTKTPTSPQTLFVFAIESRQSCRTHIEAHVFLPLSREHLTQRSIAPLRIHLSRTTGVCASRLGVTHAQDKGQLFSSRSIGRGVIHNTSRGINSLAWSGTITIAPSVFSGSFKVHGLQVSDSIVITIKPPDSARSHFMSLCETIPVRLTSEAHECSSAMAIAEAEV